MRIFVYEFVSGGGWWSVDQENPPTGSLLNEGSAMLRALLRDFEPLGSVCTLRDYRCQLDTGAAEFKPIHSAAEERDCFAQFTRNADWTIVIAPEFDRHLLDRCEWVVRSGGRQLGPGIEFVSIASDKERTARRLAEAGVPASRGVLVSKQTDFDNRFEFPAVLKPRDGAGSLDVRLVENWEQVRTAVSDGREYRLEEFHAGLAASVSVLSGIRSCHVLPACMQQLSSDNRFRYLGGSGPLAPALCDRAERLARQTIAAMPSTVGYWGMDLVLGNDESGIEDVVIEINPRLTTSYLGLRQMVRGNLAAAMLDAATGKPTDLSFASHPVQFAANGN